MGFDYSVFRVKQCKHCGQEIATGMWLGDKWQYRHADTRIMHCIKDGIMLVTTAEEDMESCECGYVMIDSRQTGDRSWDDMCPAHGVGTEHFQKLKTMPFGYAAERNTSRAEWLVFREKTEEKGEGL